MKGFSASAAHLVSYMPMAVVQQYASMPRPLPPAEPIREDYPAAIGFVDVSGFTALSERLQQENGRKGAELLSVYMNAYFKELIDQILEHGGDVIKFAGDALQVVWRAPVKHFEGGGELDLLEDSTGPRDPHAADGDADDVLPELVLTATRCCLLLLRQLDGFSPVPGVKLSLHMGIGAGTLSAFTVGGHAGKWEYFVAGEPIAQMADAAEGASSGQLVLSGPANAFNGRALARLSTSPPPLPPFDVGGDDARTRSRSRRGQREPTRFEQRSRTAPELSESAFSDPGGRSRSTSGADGEMRTSLMDHDGEEER
jgi:class 3 adenylate cyclase